MMSCAECHPGAPQSDKAGDVLIQRGTNHAWSNRSDKPCVMAFVLIDGDRRDD